MSVLEIHRQPRLRLGAVTYLNTVPLVRALPRLMPQAELTFDHPSRLADQLAEGRLDAALAPTIELASHRQWSIVSSACIGCRGPVLSVKVLFRTPPAEVKTLALDEGSRTSAVLAQVLLADRFGVRPRLEPLPLGAAVDGARADAVLVIGDRAIRSDDAKFCASWDLGQEWVRATGLPFVFAVWAVRPGVPLGELEAALNAARDEGCGELEAIAREQSAAMGLPYELVLIYLRDNLNFYLDDRARRGMELFFERAAACDLIAGHFELQCDECTTERS
jgi:chorismate dehydratase